MKNNSKHTCGLKSLIMSLLKLAPYSEEDFSLIKKGACISNIATTTTIVTHCYSSASLISNCNNPLQENNMLLEPIPDDLFCLTLQSEQRSFVFTQLLYMKIKHIYKKKGLYSSSHSDVQCRTRLAFNSTLSTFKTWACGERISVIILPCWQRSLVAP